MEMNRKISDFCLSSKRLEPFNVVLCAQLKVRRGFSLLELMSVLVLIALLTLMATPSYRAYLQRNELAEAKQQAMRLTMDLERYKARNFSYFGFDLAEQYPNLVINQNQVFLPLGATSQKAKFILTLVDYDSFNRLNQDTQAMSAAGRTQTVTNPIMGRNWAISVERTKDDGGQLKQLTNFDLLVTSTGVQCMTRTVNMVRGFRNCGVEDNQPW